MRRPTATPGGRASPDRIGGPGGRPDPAGAGRGRRPPTEARSDAAARSPAGEPSHHSDDAPGRGRRALRPRRRRQAPGGGAGPPGPIGPGPRGGGADGRLRARPAEVEDGPRSQPRQGSSGPARKPPRSSTGAGRCGSRSTASRSTAFGGDTIVSALMANGIRSYAQGRRLQTRRGAQRRPLRPLLRSRSTTSPTWPPPTGWPPTASACAPSTCGRRCASTSRRSTSGPPACCAPTASCGASTAAGFLRPAYRWLASRGDVGGRVGGRGLGHGELGSVSATSTSWWSAAGWPDWRPARLPPSRCRTLVVEADHRPGGWLRLAGEPTVAETARPAGRRSTGSSCGPTPWSSTSIRDGQAVVVADRPDGGEDLTVVGPAT